MLTERYFTSFDINKTVDVPPDRLQLWISYGWIIPTKKSPGKGKPALFNINAVLAVAIFKEMLLLGFSRKTAAAQMPHFYKHASENPRYMEIEVKDTETITRFLPYLGVEGKGDLIAMDGEVITIYKTKGVRSFHLVNIEKIRDKVVKAMKK